MSKEHSYHLTTKMDRKYRQRNFRITDRTREAIPFSRKTRWILPLHQIRHFVEIRLNIIRKNCSSHHYQVVICSGFYIYVRMQGWSLPIMIDHPTGTMIELETGGGRFKEVTLHPVVTLQNKEFAGKLNALHQRAHELCFIANSVNFEVTHQPTAK
jgi:hypothetical protein